MASTIQIRRGLAANVAAANVAAGELLVTTDTNQIYIGVSGTTKNALSIDASNVTNLPAASELVNAQSGTTYTVLTGDRGKVITYTNAGAIAVTLPQANGGTFSAGWYADFVNLGATDVTITPTTSTIGGAANFVLHGKQGIRVISDGTNYQIVVGRSVVAKSSVGSQWLNSVAADGVFTSSQPAFTDVSGTLASAQLPATIDGGTF